MEDDLKVNYLNNALALCIAILLLVIITFTIKEFSNRNQPPNDVEQEFYIVAVE